MERVIDPPADRFWESSGTIITAAGGTSRAPTTDAGWTDAVNAGFDPWETIHDANPQEILERREPVTLVPMLIMQGALDDNVLPAIQEKFAATYRAAGGVCELTVFEDSEHEWVAKPGPHTDRAHEMVKTFIARHSKA
jgi:alpha-beta hydrolase superfamily lysophospholipase